MNKAQKSQMVSIIIVNWNGLKWLKGCFPTLAKQTHKNTEWILVDNASSDESVEWTKKNYPKTKIIVNKENLGFSHANNIGYKAAGGDFILFLNNDTKTTPTFISELIKVFESDPAIGGAQSKILLMDKPDTHDSVGAYLTPTGFLYHYGFGKKDNSSYNKQIDLYTAKGACMMFRRDVLKQVEVDGWILDPDYFAYFEETDMCHRVWLAGYKIVYAYKSVIYHKMGATSSSMNNAFVQYHSFKNRIHSYMKNLGTIWLCMILPVHGLACIVFVLHALLRGKTQLAYAVIRAVWWNITQIAKTFTKRAYIQGTIRRKTDNELSDSIYRTPPLSYYISMMG
jgi:GT2 family glycosyltransferase